MSILMQIEAANKLLANEIIDVKDLLVTLRNEKAYQGKGRYSMDASTGFFQKVADDKTSYYLKDILIESDGKTFSNVYKNKNHIAKIKAAKKLLENEFINVEELIEHQPNKYKGPGFYHMATATGVILEMERRPKIGSLNQIALECNGETFKIVELSEFITNAEKEDLRVAEEKKKQARMLHDHKIKVGNDFKEKNGRGLYAHVPGTEMWIFLGKYIVRNLTREEQQKGYKIVRYNAPKYSFNRDSKKLWAAIAVTGLVILSSI